MQTLVIKGDIDEWQRHLVWEGVSGAIKHSEWMGAGAMIKGVKACNMEIKMEDCKKCTALSLYVSYNR
jgi:hypothetical protein